MEMCGDNDVWTTNALALALGARSLHAGYLQLVPVNVAIRTTRGD